MDTLQFTLLAVILFSKGLAIDFRNEDSSHWMKVGTTQLEATLKRHKQNQHAKNVIIFVGDGMGITTVTSARIYKGQKTGVGESESLSFEKFSTTGLSKTYAVNKQVTDSAASGTSLFTGVKTKYMMLGLDARAELDICNQSINEKSKIDSIMSWAQKVEKDTGFVTKTRITHATPAALYAHINDRNWECQNAIPPKYRHCVKDIASQLIANKPGNKFKVIMGGGANQLGLYGTVGSNHGGCIRTDHRNLTKEWQDSRGGTIVTTNKELMNINLNNTQYLLGVFSPDHMYYAGEKQYKSQQDQPSLVNMTTQAIKILSKNQNGFVLMVEGGLIDIAHHQNYAKLALEETLEFEEAIAQAVKMTDEENTLIIVTADHSHSLTINGYPDRGNDILGLTTNLNDAYETLTYANGPGYNYHKINSTTKLWRDLKLSVNRSGIYYRHFSPLYMQYETHGGEDVPVYANGPSSYLFSGVYESNYIAHAISYAACIGPHAKKCDGYEEGSSQHVNYVPCAGPGDKKCNQTAHTASAVSWRLSQICLVIQILLCFGHIIQEAM